MRNPAWTDWNNPIVDGMVTARVDLHTAFPVTMGDTIIVSDGDGLCACGVIVQMPQHENEGRVYARVKIVSGFYDMGRPACE